MTTSMKQPVGGSSPGVRTSARLLGSSSSLMPRWPVEMTGVEWTLLFEIEALHGLEEFAASELKQTLGIKMVRNRIEYRGRLGPLLSLRTAVAVHRYERFEGSRPHRHPRRSAAPRDAEVRDIDRPLHRIPDQLPRQGLLSDAPRPRQRRSLDGTARASRGGSPRPHPPRSGRLGSPGPRHRPLAVGPTVACGRYARSPARHHGCIMADLAAPRKVDRILNLCCGSGTLLAECRRGRHFIGVDNASTALRAAEANLAAASRTRKVPVPTSLLRADAGRLPLTDRSVDVLLCDLPYGHAIGDHQDNRSLYPVILAEAARVARPGARFAVCTQDMRLFEASISNDWHLENRLRVHQRRAIPAIYLLRNVKR